MNKKVIEKVDVLINNAGVSVFSPFEERTDRELDYVLNVNLKAPIVLSQIIFNNFLNLRKGMHCKYSFYLWIGFWRHENMPKEIEELLDLRGIQSRSDKSYKIFCSIHGSI